LEYYASMRIFALIALLSAVSAVAQSPAQNPRPATLPAVVSPEVLSDHSVVFRLRAPKASEVTVSGDYGGQPGKMVKGEDGVWSFKTDPLPSDVYSYIFTVDGVRFPDPVNGWIKPGNPPVQSMFSVPGPESEVYERKPVPHGEVRVVYYASKTLGRERRMHIYLPPGYDSSKAHYPVTYLFHGGGEEDFGWEDIGRVNFALDNLIAQGKAKPMIVVMPSLYALGPPVPQGRSQDNDELFARDLAEDVLPYVESHYRTLPGAANRAMGGLGVGRGMLPDVVWPTLGKFGTVFFVSGGTDPDRFDALMKQYPGRFDDPANVKVIRFFLGDGRNDASMSASKKLGEEAAKRGYRVTTFATDGVHGWPSFRRCFVEWVQGAFR